MSSSSKEGGPAPMTDAKKFLFDTNNFDRHRHRQEVLPTGGHPARAVEYN